MGASLLITLREGLEAGLILAIILAYLKSAGLQAHFRTVLLGALAAVLLSLIIGGAIFAIAGEFEGRAAEAFEGIMMLVAVVVLTGMIVWMKRQSATLRNSLEREVQQAIGAGSIFALALIPFSAVLREGIETSVFLYAATEASSPVQSTIGAVTGLVLAAGLTWGIYSGGYRINLRIFFNVTGVLLIFIAAGLLIHGIHELQEAALLPVFIEHVWDINNVLSDGSGIGEWLKALLGYNGNPSLIEVIAYPTFLIGGLWYFFAIKPVIDTPTPEIATNIQEPTPKRSQEPEQATK
ncbi:MAG: FTR1 family protein [Chloroflexi bacterium]|nr:FTR1 family protein [Chloroflexota bacterium]